MACHPANIASLRPPNSRFQSNRSSCSAAVFTLSWREAANAELAIRLCDWRHNDCGLVASTASPQQRSTSSRRSMAGWPCRVPVG